MKAWLRRILVTWLFPKGDEVFNSWMRDEIAAHLVLNIAAKLPVFTGKRYQIVAADEDASFGVEQLPDGPYIQVVKGVNIERVKEKIRLIQIANTDRGAGERLH